MLRNIMPLYVARYVSWYVSHIKSLYLVMYDVVSYVNCGSPKINALYYIAITFQQIGHVFSKF